MPETILVAKEKANKLVAHQDPDEVYNSGHEFYVFESSVEGEIICGEYNVDIVIRRLSDQKLFIATYKTLPLFAALEDAVPATAFGQDFKEGVTFVEAIAEVEMIPHTVFHIA